MKDALDKPSIVGPNVVTEEDKKATEKGKNQELEGS